MTPHSTLSSNPHLLHQIAAEIATPYYLYDAEILRRRLAALRTVLPTIDFFYSLKANPNLGVTSILRAEGMGCEVSSMLELEVALAAGSTSERIMMVGPGKLSSELNRAVDLGIKAIIVESVEELREIDQIAEERGVIQDVALRINPDFQTGGARLTMSGRATQFGIDQSQVHDVLAILTDLHHVRLRGLHAYMGTRILAHETIAANVSGILDLAENLASDLSQSLEFVDVGGGFGVPYDMEEPELDLDALGAAVAPRLADFAKIHPTTQVVMELGRYMVAPAGTFVTSVRQIKISKGERFAVCDGGANVHSAAAGQGSFLRKNFPITLVRAIGAQPVDDEPAPWTLTGPLCTPQDVIGKSVTMCAPSPGDLICVDQSGAYGPSASPVDFLGFGPPAEVLVDGEVTFLVKHRETVEKRLRLQEPQQILRSKGASPKSLVALASDQPRDASPFSHPCLERVEELGELLRQTGARLEADPDDWGQLWENDLIRSLTTIGVPDIYNGFPLAQSSLGISSCPYGLHVAIVERLARHDANSILSMPGPSLSGGAVLADGSPEQIERFFKGYRHSSQGTFFAVTENGGGSDASNGKTTVSRKDSRLVMSGVKVLVGGAKRADIGLVFAQIEETGRPALVMIEPHFAPDAIQIDRMKTSGMAGADLCRITLTDFPVEPEMILGSKQRSLRDGFMSINGVFERIRPMVAAMALGVGRGILDLVASDAVDRAQIEDLFLTHSALLRQLAKVVEAYEQGRPKSHEISLIKMQAVTFADAVVKRVPVVAPTLMLRDPELRRRCRDVKAFEYMEGTSNIHMMNAYRGYTAGVAV
ncbi:acyl-CoA dehydrogenase family protein [Pseudovibrio ascidiaceicola]|uniref:acyl-CoA dehydrogenase family protein n=1 Tax=Pseudovibrio ascidiaceicola TaxID=285279 RepID=UPI003D35B301